MIYLDYAATTPLRSEVREAMMPWLTNEFGNPSSHYAIGRRASEAVWNARETIANMLSVSPEEIFFTSGGSEANTWAITGLYNIDTCGYALMSNIEHHSLLNIRKKRLFIGVDKDGIVDLDTLEKNIIYDTPIVSVMMVNNEIGTIEPIDAIDDICFKHEVFLHVDAVQAFGHFPIKLTKYSAVSSMSASAHKIGGPKGIGFLYIQKAVQDLYHSLICGGQQEFGKRGGTENVAAIVGFAKACELASKEMEMIYDKNKMLQRTMWDILSNALPNAHLNGASLDSGNRMVNNLNIRFDGVRAEELMELLNTHEVYVSSGSACNSDSDEPSHVLKSIGLTDDEANSSIRITLGSMTSRDEIELASRIIINDVNLLRNR